MTRRTVVLAAMVALGIFAALGATSASAAPAAAWKLALTPMPTNFAPGATPEYFLVATNVGAGPTVGTTTIEATVPDELASLTVKGTTTGDPSAAGPLDCTVALKTATCTTAAALHPGRTLTVAMSVEVPPGAKEETVEAEASIEGGGAAQSVTTITPTPIASATQPFAFLPGFGAPLSEEDGAPATAAGSHPYQLTVDLGFPSERPGDALTGAGHPHSILANLPRGLLGNPAATPVLCTEAELTSEESPGCPRASQVGVISLTTGIGIPFTEPSNLYAMVPPPGTVAVFGTNAAGIGIFVHLVAGVRTDGDYGAYAVTDDVPAPSSNPLFNIQAQLWGDPASAAHDQTRGKCLLDGGSCPELEPAPTKKAFLTLPSDCPGKPLAFKASADSWEQPGLFTSTEYESADLEGNPVSVDGCAQLEFKPTISLTPTTNLTDSPSGLEVKLHQPQSTDFEGRSTANLKDAVVTLPAGMAVNPSQAAGLDACSSARIGLGTPIGQTPIHFSKAPQSCPDAAKLGTLEVTSPLLAEYDDRHEIERDPETGEPIPRPLAGSVYLAKPFDNPFGSLLAIYFAIEDPQTGIVAKLAGRVEADPITGRLTTRFAENPELPIEDIELHLFGGARGALITPLACATHTTSADLTPWSSPEGPDAHLSDSFATTAAPGGGTCPGSESQAPNSPSFSAGTIAPQAGAYSPFVLKLSREDGSQRLEKIDATLAPGLSGKLAGIGTCSEAQIAAAVARSHPNEGALERAAPSCPASSEVGVVDVAAGAGPTPFHVQGHAYLSGPYKGAPLSLAIVTPATAGPFDLGAVVVRTALHVDPVTAQIHAVSDPLPQIIEGIPLDVRSIALKMARPDFTLNPTSCDPMAITASATSSLGQSAALTSPFQVGGCSQLPFKPKLSLRLKGGTKRAAHPKLIATLTAKPGEANIAKASVQLPRSAFLDQAHIRTVCTRVQFAADACPKGSIYGTATATTPLLDYPIAGNVYLRSSNNKLPDLVVALKGPERQPIEIDLAGRTDSVKGALRNTFDLVPDAPVSKFRLELFGGKRGLVINSRNLCAHAYRAKLQLDGQNGKVFDSGPVVKSDCGRKRKGERGGKGRHRR